MGQETEVMTMSTLYRIALVPAPETYRIGLAFVHTQNADFDFFAGGMLRFSGLESEWSNVGRVFVTLSLIV